MSEPETHRLLALMTALDDMGAAATIRRLNDASRNSKWTFEADTGPNTSYNAMLTNVTAYYDGVRMAEAVVSVPKPSPLGDPRPEAKPEITFKAETQNPSYAQGLLWIMERAVRAALTKESARLATQRNEVAVLAERAGVVLVPDMAAAGPRLALAMRDLDERFGEQLDADRSALVLEKDGFQAKILLAAWDDMGEMTLMLSAHAPSDPAPIPVGSVRCAVHAVPSSSAFVYGVHAGLGDATFVALAAACVSEFAARCEAEAEKAKSLAVEAEPDAEARVLAAITDDLGF